MWKSPDDTVIASSCWGRCLRLEGDRRTAYVAPHLIPMDNPISDVNDVFNAVVVRGNATGEVMFYGKGAGGTANGFCRCGRRDGVYSGRPAPPGDRLER